MEVQRHDLPNYRGAFKMHGEYDPRMDFTMADAVKTKRIGYIIHPVRFSDAINVIVTEGVFSLDDGWNELEVPFMAGLAEMESLAIKDYRKQDPKMKTIDTVYHGFSGENLKPEAQAKGFDLDKLLADMEARKKIVKALKEELGL